MWLCHVTKCIVCFCQALLNKSLNVVASCFMFYWLMHWSHSLFSVFKNEFSWINDRLDLNGSIQTGKRVSSRWNPLTLRAPPLEPGPRSRPRPAQLLLQFNSDWVEILSTWISVICLITVFSGCECASDREWVCESSCSRVHHQLLLDHCSRAHTHTHTGSNHINPTEQSKTSST